MTRDESARLREAIIETMPAGATFVGAVVDGAQKHGAQISEVFVWHIGAMVRACLEDPNNRTTVAGMLTDVERAVAELNAAEAEERN